MKKYLLKSFIILIGIITFHSCTTKEDTTVNKVFDTVTNGAILRTVSVNQGTFNFFDTSSKWSITIEEQDNSNGTLFKEVKIYSKHKKGTVTSTERFIKTIPASTFQVAAPRGLPQTKIEFSLQEILTALSIPAGGYTTSDVFTFRLELIMNDGRVFNASNTSQPITNNYFNSPFTYNVPFFCPFADVSNFNGDYKVVTDVWADYAPGSIVPVVYNAANGLFKFRILNTNNPLLVNTSSYYEVTVKQSDGTVTVKSNETLDYGGGFTTNATGTGTIGSCTGDINLKLNFSGSLQQQTFNLIKN